MAKILTWCKSKTYVWHRAEYRRVFNILLYSQCVTVLAIAGLGLTTNLQSLISVLGLLLGVQMGAYATIRFIDEHEKKIN
jgi:3-oxoacyl-(acyl-carrier-protein) synthase